MHFTAQQFRNLLGVHSGYVTNTSTLLSEVDAALQQAVTRLENLDSVDTDALR